MVSICLARSHDYGRHGGSCLYDDDDDEGEGYQLEGTGRSYQDDYLEEDSDQEDNDDSDSDEEQDDDNVEDDSHQEGEQQS